MQRTIITIDEEKCDGCGLCVQGCAEGALAIVDGKARLVSEVYCDGLGACLGECPRGAIRTELREAAAFDPVEVERHLLKKGGRRKEEGGRDDHHHAHAGGEGCACAHGGAGEGEKAALPPFGKVGSRKEEGGRDDHHHAHAGGEGCVCAHGGAGDEEKATLPPSSFLLPPSSSGCPGSRLRQMAPPAAAPAERSAGAMSPSQLRSWPVQLALVPPQAGFLKGADILLCADCVPFAVPDFHQKYLAGRVVLVGCPKLDNLPAYTQKLAAIYSVAQPRSVTVLRMEVPCCAGLAQAANRAKEAIGSEVPVETVIVGIGGEELG